MAVLCLYRRTSRKKVCQDIKPEDILAFKGGGGLQFFSWSYLDNALNFVGCEGYWEVSSLNWRLQSGDGQLSEWLEMVKAPSGSTGLSGDIMPHVCRLFMTFCQLRTTFEHFWPLTLLLLTFAWSVWSISIYISVIQYQVTIISSPPGHQGLWGNIYISRQVI